MRGSVAGSSWEIYERQCSWQQLGDMRGSVAGSSWEIYERQCSWQQLGYL